MHLDFLTLYIVILLNSLTLSIVWGAICCAYANFGAARHWLAACLLTTLGGALLALEALPHGLVFTTTGIALVALGFGMMWGGVRVFHGRPPPWRTILALFAVSLLVCALVATSDRDLRNIVYAAVQGVPIILAAWSLLTLGRRHVGTLVAAGGTAIALLGHGTEMALNALRLTGDLSTEAYYGVAACLLLAVIFGCTVWNLGFVLMAVDRLRSELAELAVTDELTGLPNRRQFLDAAARLEVGARRSGASFSVLLVDVDRFKAINDTHGHAAGDACLKAFAVIASQRIRAGDMLARIGGDEFCILLPDATARQAADLARDLVGRIAAAGCQWRRHAIPITVSVGIAEWRPAAAASVADMLEQADAALYRAKTHGRNGYSLYEVAPAAGQPRRSRG